VFRSGIPAMWQLLVCSRAGSIIMFMGPFLVYFLAPGHFAVAMNWAEE